MTQSDDTSKKPAGNTGATEGTGYENKQGDYPAYTGRIAEAVEKPKDAPPAKHSDASQPEQPSKTKS